LGTFLNYRSRPKFGATLIQDTSDVLILPKNGLGYILGEFFKNSSGTDVMIFENIFAELAFLTENKANKKLIITFVFEKNANFFAENCHISQKIVIITSVPGHPARDLARWPVE
jgi:hypothetical protein